MNDLQSLYLLWATILNQSQSAEQVLLNTIELFNRLGLKKNFNEGLKSLSYEKNIKKIKEKSNIEDVLEILRELAENEIITLNVEKQKQGKIPKNYLTAPFRVFYDITYKCNLRCKHCFTNSGIENDKELSLNEKINLIEHLYDLGVICNFNIIIVCYI